jgi:malate dehydrogenase
MPGNFKVCVVGGAGGIGQPLSMLLTMDPNVAEVCVYDLTIAMVPAAGVACDLSHINKKARVTGYAFDKDDKAIEKAGTCLTGCDLVMVPAGLPRKPGMDRKDLLNINAGIAKNIVEACAKHCPNAVVALIVNPVNSVVPAMCELWKKKGLNPRRIVGVTSLDCVRAEKFIHEASGVDPSEIDIPVIGGHAGITILPLFSQCEASKHLEGLRDLDAKVQDAGTVVVKEKSGKGSATLSMGYAGYRLAKVILAGLAGESSAIECAYVESTVCSEVPYFASKVKFGLHGIEEVLGIGELSEYEKTRLEALLPTLKEEIDAGLMYAAENSFAD